MSEVYAEAEVGEMIKTRHTHSDHPIVGRFFTAWIDAGYYGDDRCGG